MLDLRTGSVMQTYPDIQNFRMPAASLISPCGSWVLGGSDCGVSQRMSVKKINEFVYFRLVWCGTQTLGPSNTWSESQSTIVR